MLSKNKIMVTLKSFVQFFTDQLESIQSEDQANHDFLRLYTTNQMLNSLFTCSISYDAFMNGYHIVAYDLTSSQDAGSEAFVNPSVRVGKNIVVCFTLALECNLLINLHFNVSI